MWGVRMEARPVEMRRRGHRRRRLEGRPPVCAPGAPRQQLVRRSLDRGARIDDIILLCKSA